MSAGQELATKISPPKSKPSKKFIYSFSEAAARIRRDFEATSEVLDRIAAEACPNDDAVAFFAVHPQYVSKSYYPEEFFELTGLRPVGSRRSKISPAKGRAGDSAEYYVAGTRDQFRTLPELVLEWNEAVARTFPDGESDQMTEADFAQARLLPVGAREIVRFESVTPVTPRDRIGDLGEGESLSLEAILHLTPGDSRDDSALYQFGRFVESLGGQALMDRRIVAEGLTFVPVRLERSQIDRFAQFSLLRFARRAALMSRLQPALRSYRRDLPPVRLPAPGPDNGIRVAIIDGGIDSAGVLGPYVNSRDIVPIGAPVSEYVAHGTGVTSAALFGPLTPGEAAPQPFARIDHLRVFDQDTAGEDPFELFTVLGRLKSGLTTGAPYDFVNISVGPTAPVEDDQPHAWSTVLDSLLGDGRTFATVAVGNTGENDRDSGNARVLPPSDAVNALSVGAANRIGEPWERASYSSVGPGRRPGIMKPDVVGFGGSDLEDFYVVDSSGPGIVRPTAGTSFAAPAVLRCALGLRATYGPDLTAVGLRALLVHAAEEPSQLSELRQNSAEARLLVEECGWGRVPLDHEQIVLGLPSSVRILYQGRLGPASHTRIVVPIPSALTGMVDIAATFCFATQVDPQDPMSYTRAALVPTFRPHAEKFSATDDELDRGHDEESDGDSEFAADDVADALRPKTRPFFQAARMHLIEEEQRKIGFKWEPILHGYTSLRPTSLLDPVFDVHYVSRRRGGRDTHGMQLPYALVVTVSAPKHLTLYDDVLTQYRTLLTPLHPVSEVGIPVRT